MTSGGLFEKRPKSDFLELSVSSLEHSKVSESSKFAESSKKFPLESPKILESSGNATNLF
jgi:hypothetical protein